MNLDMKTKEIYRSESHFLLQIWLNELRYAPTIVGKIDVVENLIILLIKYLCFY